MPSVTGAYTGTRRSAKAGARRVAVAALLVICSAGVRSAEACSCAVNPPCAAVWRADAVFIGTVVDRAPERIGGLLSWSVTAVAVSQTFRGSVGTFVTLVPGNRPTAEQIAASQARGEEATMMSSCDYDFEPGRQYLIYARRTAEGRWTTAMCTGTKPVEDAAADLDYLATIPGAEPTGRVYGHVERAVDNPADRTTLTAVPAEGVQVAIVSGASRITTRTDKEGKIDVRVPPGEYTIAPVVPETVRMYGAPVQASVPARGCASVNFSLIANGRIEGRVVRPDGTPVRGASVDVVPADLAPGERPNSSSRAPSSTTDEKGRFSVDAILPGRYVVGVNAQFGPRLSAPYATTWFPGVARQDARVVEIDEGERKTGFTIAVTPLAEATISGVVLFADGQPAAGAHLTAAPVDHKGLIMGSATTDSSGAFEIRVLTGSSYLIQAGLRTEQGPRQTESVVLVVKERLEGLRLSLAR